MKTEWASFLVEDVFEIINGSGITKEEIEENPGDLNAIQSGEINNGILGKINREYCRQKNYAMCESPCLTVARTGSAGYVSFQKYGCVVGDSAKILKLKNEIDVSDEVMVFLQTILSALRPKYAYGRKVTKDKYSKEEIMLPITPSGTPDWQFMEDYVKTLHYKKLSTTNTTKSAIKLNIELWESFQLKDIFTVINGKGLTTEEIENYPGDIYCIQGGEENNGSIGQINKEYCRKNGYTIIEKMCLTVARVGTAGCVNLWEAPCAIGDKCKGLILKTSAKKEIYLFLATLLRKLSDKYNYGRGLVTEKYMNEYIKLPVMPDGTPDWQFMEDYIKSLPYGDRI